MRRLVVVGGEGGYEYIRYTNTQQSIGWGFVGGYKHNNNRTYHWGTGAAVADSVVKADSTVVVDIAVED